MSLPIPLPMPRPPPGLFSAHTAAPERPRPLLPFLVTTPDDPPDRTLACIALGSNVGEREAHIRAAVAAIAAFPSTVVVALSSIHETHPVGPVAQGLFLNAAVCVRTGLSPHDLLAHLQRVELENGRDRRSGQRWGPRTLDLDMLLYGDRVIDEPGLTVPHPRMHERGFVLAPLAEVAPDFVVPTLGKPVRALLAELNALTPEPR